MPLMTGKSQNAFSKNVGTEMDAGKPQKQALAIAYAMKRRNKMYKGGMADGESNLKLDASHESADGYNPYKDIVHAAIEHMCSGGMSGYALGGEVEHVGGAEVGDPVSIGDGYDPIGDDDCHEAFLSDESDGEFFDPMDEDEKKKMAKGGLIEAAMQSIRQRHMGK